MIVVPVLITSCQVSEKLKIGPVKAQVATTSTQTMNAPGLPVMRAVAVANFLAWFAAEAPRGTVSEISAAERLLEFRRAVPGFTAESFPAISGAAENGAIVHYRATAAGNRTLNPDECYLIDSGGQYPDGTTDITRTLWSGPGPAPDALRARYTAVLRGHIALGTLRFPVGVAGPHLDAIARRPLWEAGLDYDHGTGHGVGSFLSVHEGPVAFSRAARVVPIQPGMILSNEPGYYLPGHYGIRIENLLLTREALMGSSPIIPGHNTKLAPLGRLDMDSRGLLILSADGVLAKALVGPDSELDKEYLVRVAGDITEGVLNKLRHGLSLDGRQLKPARVEVMRGKELQFILNEGRNRQIRRMCELVGLTVKDLFRVRIGPLRLGGLQEGKWRVLKPEEREALIDASQGR